MNPTLDLTIEFSADYLEFFRLFNERSFYDAHEALESLWVTETGQARDYYKGLIMIAAALLHWQNGRPGPSLKLHRRAREILSAYPDQYEGFRLGDFLRAIDTLFSRLAIGSVFEPLDDAAIPVIVLAEPER